MRFPSLLASLLCLVLLSALPGHAAEPADLVLTNGYVYTVDDARSVKEAVAVLGERILFVGSAAEAARYVGKKTRVVDLKGRMLLPGFLDAHTHVAGAQQRRLYELSIKNLEFVEAYERKIRAFALDEKAKGLKVVRGAGWDNGAFVTYNTKRYGSEYATLGPSAALLDEILKGTNLENTPVMFNSSDGHSTWANSKALEHAKLLNDTAAKDPDGGKIERDPKTGAVWGTFRDTARALILERIPRIRYTQEQYTTALKLFEKDMHSYGITGVMGVSGSSGTLPDPAQGEMYNALASLERKGELGLIYRMSVYAKPGLTTQELINQAVTLRERHKSSQSLRYDAVKVFADGVIEGRTGYLLEPYADNKSDAKDYKGRLLRKPEEVEALVKALDAKGLQVHVHSIGDGASRVYIDAFAAAAKANGRRDARHTLTHIQLVADSDMQRMAELDVVAAAQPYWFFKDPSLYYQVESVVLGPERAAKEYPLKRFFNHGVLVTSSSDSPVTGLPAPLTAIEIGVTRNAPGALPAKYDTLGPEERVSRERMIETFTINAARQMFAEKLMGSIEKGKLANFVVLDKNILNENAVPDWEIAKTPVARTYFLGRLVYDATAVR